MYVLHGLHKRDQVSWLEPTCLNGASIFDRGLKKHFIKIEIYYLSFIAQYRPQFVFGFYSSGFLKLCCKSISKNAAKFFKASEVTFDLPFHYFDGEVSGSERAKSIMKFHALVS